MKSKTFTRLHTSPALAERLVDLACFDQLPSSASILEPSAGMGQLAATILDRLKTINCQASLSLYEIDPPRFDRLQRHFCEVPILKHVVCQCYEGDFLQSRDLGLFDRILAHPPLGQGEDLKHVLKMLEYLAPGGILVTIIAGRGASLLRKSGSSPAAIQMQQTISEITSKPGGSVHLEVLPDGFLKIGKKSATASILFVERGYRRSAKTR